MRVTFWANVQWAIDRALPGQCCERCFWWLRRSYATKGAKAFGECCWTASGVPKPHTLRWGGQGTWCPAYRWRLALPPAARSEIVTRNS